MTAIALDGPRRGPASGRAARQLVVLLHGVGSDGDDLAGLIPLLAHALPDAAFVSPHAPYDSDLASDRTVGRQWFSLNDLTPARVEAGAREASVILDAFIAHERARLKLPAEAVALVGFSQGAMMALYSGLRRAPGPGAVLSYAGVLLGGEATLAEEVRWRPPVLLVHGTEDTIVPPGFSQQAERSLSALSVPVRALFRRGMAHTIDDESIAAGGAFLADWAEGALIGAMHAAPRQPMKLR